MMHGKIIDHEKKSKWMKNLSYHVFNVVDSVNSLKNLRQTHGMDLKFVHKERKPYVKKYINLV